MEAVARTLGKDVGPAALVTLPDEVPAHSVGDGGIAALAASVSGGDRSPGFCQGRIWIESTIA